MSNEVTLVDRIEGSIDRPVAGAMAINSRGITFANAAEAMEYAKLMAVSDVAVPRYLRGKPGACLAIVEDSLRVGMSPFALARKSYEVNGTIAYEAQVLAAIVLGIAPLRDRPEYHYEGNGQDRACTVRMVLNSGQTIEHQSPRLGTIFPKNSPLWKTDPDQQLGYYTMRAAARRHFPDILLGMYDADEMAAAVATDVSPKVKLDEKLKGSPDANQPALQALHEEAQQSAENHVAAGDDAGDGGAAGGAAVQETGDGNGRLDSVSEPSGEAPESSAPEADAPPVADAAVADESPATETAGGGDDAAGPGLSDDEAALMKELTDALAGAATQSEVDATASEFSGAYENASEEVKALMRSVTKKRRSDLRAASASLL